MSSLVVIIPDRLSDLIKKGEITTRYYNPGELFDDVHILLTNDDNPNEDILQKTVGKAKLHIHNLPVPSFIRTLGWQPFLLNSWVDSGVQLVKNIEPSLIRAHGNLYNGYLGAKIKQRLNIPLVVSVHTNPLCSFMYPKSF